MTNSSSAETDIDLEGVRRLALRLVRHVSENRRRIVVSGISFAGLGVLLSFCVTPEYSASTRLIPYTSSPTASLASIANIAGIRIPEASSQQTVPASLYPELASTSSFLHELAQAPLFIGQEGARRPFESYTATRKRSVVEILQKYTIGLPGVLIGQLSTADSAKLPSSAGPMVRSREQDRVIRELRGRIRVSQDRRTSVVSIEATLPDAFGAVSLVEATRELLYSTTIAIENKKSRERLAFITEQHAIAKNAYEDAQLALARWHDRNRSVSTQTGAVEKDQLEREMTLAFEVYQQLSRDKTQAQIAVEENTPVFTTIDEAVVPQRRESPRRTKWAALGLLIGLLSSPLYKRR